MEDTPASTPAALRIGVEAISAGTGFSSGAGGMISYYDGLLRALADRDDIVSIVVFVSPWNRSLAVPEHPKLQTVTCHGLPRGRTGRVVYEQLVLPMLARRAGVQALICTVNIMPLLRRAPTVVVLQSIQHFLWPEQIGRLRRAYLRFFTPRSLRQAGAVVAVTETERRDALDLFPKIDPERVISVYHGASNWTHELRDKPEPYRLQGEAPYVFCVSRLYTHKNHRRLIDAYALLVADGDIPHQLVIAGGDGDVTAAELEGRAARLGVADRVHLLGMVPQDLIPSLFAGATAVAYPSLYETFGHPVLETFAAQVPLVTSSAGATAEVAGGAAQLVDPESVEDMADGLRAVVTDPDLRERLVAAGERRLADFSWESSAAGHMRAVELARNGT